MFRWSRIYGDCSQIVFFFPFHLVCIMSFVDNLFMAICSRRNYERFFWGGDSLIDVIFETILLSIPFQRGIQRSYHLIKTISSHFISSTVVVRSRWDLKTVNQNTTMDDDDLGGSRSRFQPLL